MKRLSYVLLGLALMYGLSACQGGGTKPTKSDMGPAWALNPPTDSEYYYFSGVAEGIEPVEQLQKAATEDAKTKLSAYIFEKFSSEEVISTYGNLQDSEALKQDYARAVQSKTKSSLSAVDVDKTEAKNYNDGGLTITKVWVLVKVQKSAVEKERQRIMDEMKRQLELVDKEVRKAESLIKEGKVLQAIDAYITAALASTKVEERKEEFLIYISKANRVLAGLMIETDDVPGKIDKDSGGEVKFKVSYNGDTSINVSGAKITFVLRDNKGDYASSATSDANGIVTCRVKKLDQVNGDTKLYAKIGLELGDVRNLEGDYEKYYSQLRSTLEKVSASASFRVVSEANKNIVNSVIAINNQGGSLSKIPQITSEMQSYLLSKGYKVVRFPDNVSLQGMVDMNTVVFKQLANQGIKRVYVLVVDGNVEPKYEETVGKYRAMYAVSAQLIETDTGDVMSSKSVRVGGNADSPGAVFSSFLNTAAKKLKETLDKM